MSHDALIYARHKTITGPDFGSSIPHQTPRNLDGLLVVRCLNDVRYASDVAGGVDREKPVLVQLRSVEHGRCFVKEISGRKDH